jgi:hypothetical protein
MLSELKDVEKKKSAAKEAFAMTEEPLGWYIAGWLSVGPGQFDFYEESAREDAAGDSWSTGCIF